MEKLNPTSANSCSLTPLTFLERAAIVYGDCPSVVYNSTTYTWLDTYHRCLSLASSISNLGIKRHHVVSVLAPNIPAIYELQFAIPMAGAILNNINTRLDARTISVILHHSESKLVFVDHQLYSVLVAAIQLLPVNIMPPMLILITDDDATLPTAVGFHSTHEVLVERGDPKFKWIKPENEWDPMTLNYTSGTTSSPKGVVHSHRSLFIMTLDSLIDWSVPKQPVYLWTLPMFHSNGWSFTWGMAAVGGTNICVRKFDAAVVFSAINKYHVTHMCGAPVVLNMLSNSPNANPLKNPIHFLTGGAPPPAAVLLRTEKLGFIVTHGYGLTEVAGVVVSCAWKRRWNKLPALERARLNARQGVRTIGMSEVDIVDPNTGISVTRDGLTQGEIVLRGGSIMLGYLKDKLGTATCMKENGWFYTGDVGVMHPDGYMEIKDRSKDVIISGGENVSSVEVESVLYTFPNMKEAAVVAMGHELWGEIPCAFMSWNTSCHEDEKNLAGENEIIEFCRERLPHYMVPKKVVFMKELPKTATGKIKKHSLRAIAQEMTTSSMSKL